MSFYATCFWSLLFTLPSAPVPRSPRLGALFPWVVTPLWTGPGVGAPDLLRAVLSRLSSEVSPTRSPSTSPQRVGTVYGPVLRPAPDPSVSSISVFPSETAVVSGGPSV